VKPDWAELIKTHTSPGPGDEARPGTALVLKEGVIGVSIRTGSGRRTRIPFLHRKGSVPGSRDRLILDISNEDFLLFKKKEAYFVGGQSRHFTIKHCIPWDKIVAIVFVESANAQPQSSER
jgi:hypothetical protein